MGEHPNRGSTRKAKNSYPIPAICLAGVLIMLLFAFSGGKSAEASEQTKAVKTETAAVVAAAAADKSQVETKSPEEKEPFRAGNSSAIEPTGWHSVQYDGIDGGYLYNRCHLIGYQLTGQAADAKNLITGTRYMNLEGMLPFENSVRMYVEGTGNHVLYRVRPYYSGDNLVAKGVLMEAKSIEDPLVQFCAFCYNVQPDIEIDYATGESFVKAVGSGDDDVLALIGDPGAENDASVTRSAAEETPANEPEDEAPASAVEEEPEVEEPEEITYILNTNTKKFHYPYCKSVKSMKDKNKRETTQSRDEIIRQGYDPCKNCNP